VQYTVSASGDIAGYERIHVEPETSITLSQIDKEDITATIEQKIVDFRPNNWDETFTETDGRLKSTDKGAKDPINATGTITANGITAGTWYGTFNFNIEIIGYMDFTLTASTYSMTGLPTSNCGDLVVPETFMYEGKYYKTVAIGAYAFKNCNGLTSITLPDTVTRIKTNAFTSMNQYTNAFSLVVPGSVKTIEGSAFYDCKELKSITFSEGLTSIGSTAFYNCRGLQEVELPSTLTSMGNHVFCWSINIKTVYIPSSVKSIVSQTASVSTFQGDANVKVYCEPSSKPSGWQTYWNYYDDTNTVETHWGVTREQYKQIVAENQ
jgi:hypothetical protein